MTSAELSLDRQLTHAVNATCRLKRRAARFGRAVTRCAEGLDFIARGTLHVWRNRRYLTVTKLINMALANLQFRLKTERVIGMPYKMKIESTNICNTKCQLCPTGLGMQGRDKGKMTFDQFRTLIAQHRRYLVALDLSMWGDPLIVPDIYRMIRHAHDQGIWTYISSNLHAFKPEKGQAEQLVESGLDLLTCSLHGASQETYEIYQPGKRFDESVAKIRGIIETRRRLGSRTPDIQLNFVVTRFNEHEKPAFEKLAAELGVKPVFSWAALNTRFIGKDRNLVSLGLADDIKARQTEAHLRKWLPESDEDALGIYRQMLEGDVDPQQFNGRKMYNCPWPWRETVINWDGNVSTCCGSFDPGEDMGNVFERPLRAIWNGPKYRAARRSFKRKLEAEDAADNPCATCPGFMI